MGAVYSGINSPKLDYSFLNSPKRTMSNNIDTSIINIEKFKSFEEPEMLNLYTDSSIKTDDIYVDSVDEKVSFGDCVIETLEGYWDSTKGFFSDAYDWLASFWQKEENGHLKIANIFESLGATVTLVCTSIVEGVAKFGEAIVDCVALIGTGLISIVSAPIDLIVGSDFTEYMYEEIYGFIEKDYVGNFFDFYYEETGVGSWIKDNAYGFDTVRTIGSGIGYTVGVIALAFLTCGASVATEGLTASSMAIPAFFAGVGKGAENAYQNDGKNPMGTLSALVNGAWESLQFYIGGKINGLSPFQSTSANILTRIGLDTLDGGAEGFVQPAIASIYSTSYYDEETGQWIDFDEDDTIVDKYLENWNDQGGMKQVMTQALLGGLMSGGSELFGYVTRNTKLKHGTKKLNEKLASNPYAILTSDEIKFITEAKTKLRLADNTPAKEVIDELMRITKNLDYDHINTKSLDMGTLKKLSDSVDGLDPVVQKDILSAITGSKDLSSVKNVDQFNNSISKYLKSLTSSEIADMDGQSTKALKQYIVNELKKNGNDLSPEKLNNFEDLFSAYKNIEKPSNSVNKVIDFEPLKTGENAFEIAQGKSPNAKMYNSFEAYSKNTESSRKAWMSKLKKGAYVDPVTNKKFSYEDLVYGYIGETDSRPGCYALLNTVNRAWDTDPSKTLFNLLKKDSLGNPIMKDGKYIIEIKHCFGSQNEYTYDPITGMVSKLAVGGGDCTFQQLLDRVESETKTLNYILSLNESNESIILGRGTGWNALEKYGISSTDSVETIYKKLTSSGQVYVDEGFMSSTPELGGGFMSCPVNFVITTKEGAALGNFADYNPCEKEILIASGSKFEITGVKKDSGGEIYIYMTQV